MKELLLAAQNLQKAYGDVVALNGLSLTIRQGTIAVLIGENGAGKTTFIRILMGFTKKDFGDITLNTDHVGYLPEQPTFFCNLSGNDILIYTGKYFGIRLETMNILIQKYAAKVIFDMALLKREFYTYSLGNKKKFALLQNLIVSPEFLVVDEPFNALDPSSIRGFRNLFLEMRSEGKTILISSHVITEIEKIADDFIIIKKGQTLFQDNLQEFTQSHALFVLSKNDESLEDLKSFTKYIKVREGRIEFFIKKDLIRPMTEVLDRKGLAVEERKIDLETTYFHFSE
jgi:ABC-2 type transport system ATP-binding protein